MQAETSGLVQGSRQGDGTIYPSRHSIGRKGKAKRDKALVTEELERRGRRRRWLVDYPRAIPVLIFLMVMAMTVVSVFAIERGEEDRRVAEINRRAQALESAIERRAFTGASYLRAGAALLSAQSEVSEAMFNRFVSELPLDSNYRGSDGIGWAPVLTLGEIPEFNRTLGQRGSDLALRPPVAHGPERLVVPVLYLQPDTNRNRRAIGFDMYSERARRAAMDEAARTARPTATGKVVLEQEGGKQDPGFLIYMPVFDASEGVRKLKGFVYSPFNANRFLAASADFVSDEGFGARLYDVEGAERRLIAALPGWRAGGTTFERKVLLADRAMILAVQSTPDSLLSAMSMITLLSGLAVASLLMLVARLMTQQALEDGRSLDLLIEQNSIRNSLTRELNHRVKNSLANVLSIVALTRRRASGLDEFAEGIEARIRALSATHDLLTQSEWGTTPLQSVVEVELVPYTHDRDHEIVLEGPVIELAPNDALSLGLALHELATNAAKFGALSVAGGRIEVRWALQAEGLARIDWIESGGPPVVQTAHRGFGTELIEKIVAHELRHPVELDFAADGVRCVLLVPVRQSGEFTLRQKLPDAK